MSETTTTLTRERMGSYIQWSISKAELGTKTLENVMMNEGYHPAGYGQPHDVTDDGTTVSFRCWSSCD